MQKREKLVFRIFCAVLVLNLTIGNLGWPFIEYDMYVILPKAGHPFYALRAKTESGESFLLGKWADTYPHRPEKIHDLVKFLVRKAGTEEKLARFTKGMFHTLKMRRPDLRELSLEGVRPDGRAEVMHRAR